MRAGRGTTKDSTMFHREYECGATTTLLSGTGTNCRGHIFSRLPCSASKTPARDRPNEYALIVIGWNTPAGGYTRRMDSTLTRELVTLLRRLLKFRIVRVGDAPLTWMLVRPVANMIRPGPSGPAAVQPP